LGKSIEEFLDAEWFAKPDDLVGGWCVMPIDMTPAEAPQGIGEVASFTFKEAAEHIANLHNTWLFYKQRRPKKYHDILV